MAPKTPDVPKKPTPQPVQAVTATPVTAYGLPLSVISKADITRSLREVQQIEDYFHQAALKGSKDQQIPRQSQVLEAIVLANHCNLLHAEQRQQLITFLTKLKEHAPVVHMSFPSEPTGEFMMKIVEWFRREVHPHIVVHVGLQPALAAGCTVRTTNKVFDFSFRNRFEKSKQKLVAALEASA